MINMKKFIYIFVIFWIGDSLGYLLLSDTNFIESFLASESIKTFSVRFIIALISSFIILYIFNKITQLKNELMDTKDYEVINLVNKVLASLSIPMKSRLDKICEILIDKFDFLTVFITIESDLGLKVITKNSTTKMLLDNNFNISLNSNQNIIKEAVLKEFNCQVSSCSKKVKKNINGVYVSQVLNIPLSSKSSKTNLGVLSVIISSKKVNVEKALEFLKLICENIAFSLYIDRQKKSLLDRLKYKKRENDLKNLMNVSIDNYDKVTSKLDYEIKRAVRYKNYFSIILFDIDGFDEVRDELSDELVLKIELAIISLVKDIIREVDTFGLWKDDSFVIVVPETDLEGARKLSFKIKDGLIDINIKEADFITCSFGVAEFNSVKEDNELKFVDRAERALKLAKEKGDIVKTL